GAGRPGSPGRFGAHEEPASRPLGGLHRDARRLGGAPQGSQRGSAFERWVARAVGAGPPVSSVLLVGTGQVGIRAARQLADTPGVTRLWVASRDGDRATELASIMGRIAEPNPTDAVHVPDDVAGGAIASKPPRSSGVGARRAACRRVGR